MDTKTVMKWRRYLVENGWLVETGEVAGSKYEEPTTGSWKVPVVRVDDPTTKAERKCSQPVVNLESSCSKSVVSVGESPTLDRRGMNKIPVVRVDDPTPKKGVGNSPTPIQPNASVGNIPTDDLTSKTDISGVGEIPTPQNSYKGLLVIGSSYGSEYDSSSQYDSPSRCRVLVELPTNAANKSAKTSNSSDNHKAKDGTPWPDDFNSWTNVQRTTWLDDHKTPLGVSVTSKTTAKPNSKPPCPHCGVVPAAFGCDCI
jgi:hypothetical protein